jgi:SAM-dependent methyltransferase
MRPIDRMRPDEWIAGLEDLCRQLVTPASVVVEIGSFAGESAAIFARHAKTVYAIDPWPASYARDIVTGCHNVVARDYVARAGVVDMTAIETLFDARVSPFRNVHKVKARDEDVIAQFPDASIDLVYIDSIHTYEAVHAAIRRWYPKVKADGVCAGHDYVEGDWPGVVAAVNEAFGAPPFLFRDTSWAIRKAETPLRMAGASKPV